MKKGISIRLVILLVLSLTACKQENHLESDLNALLSDAGSNRPREASTVLQGDTAENITHSEKTVESEAVEYGENPALFITNVLKQGAVYQQDSDTVGSGYREIFYFTEDGECFWFASQYGLESSGGEPLDCRFQYGTWEVQETVPHGEIDPGNYTELILQVKVSDWLKGGAWRQDETDGLFYLEEAIPVRKTYADEQAYYEISIQEGTVTIYGSPFYPVKTPLTDEDMLPWLRAYVKDEVPAEYSLSIDEMADRAAAEKQSNP